MAESPEETVRRYLAVVAAGGPKEALEPLLDPAIEQTEYPHAFSPKTRVHDKAQILAGLDAGARSMAEQTYGEPELMVSGDTVVAEFDWSGFTAIDLGPLPKGTQLSARICAIIRVRDGRVYAQRNYDCYAPPVPPGEVSR